MGTGDWWGRSGSQEVEAGISVLGRSGPQAWPVGGRRRKQEGQREKQSFGVDLTGHLRDPWGALELEWPFRAEFAWNVRPLDLSSHQHWVCLWQTALRQQ